MLPKGVYHDFLFQKKGLHELSMSNKKQNLYNITLKCAISRDVSIILLFLFQSKKNELLSQRRDLCAKA